MVWYLRFRVQAIYLALRLGYNKLPIVICAESIGGIVHVKNIGFN